MRDRKKGGFLLAAGVIFVAVSVFVKDSYYANILRSWGIAWVVIRSFAAERIFLL